jgi:hypothetical protein
MATVTVAMLPDESQAPDDGDDTKDAGKKKKWTVQKSKNTVRKSSSATRSVGRKENVEEAKRRIVSQVERLVCVPFSQWRFLFIACLCMLMKPWKF